MQMNQKSPEMNESESDKYRAQRWAHSFKKQKSYSDLKMEEKLVFFFDLSND